MITQSKEYDLLMKGLKVLRYGSNNQLRSFLIELDKEVFPPEVLDTKHNAVIDRADLTLHIVGELITLLEKME